MPKHEARPLPYAPGAVKGISEETMSIHHDKLYQGYVAKRNEIEEALATADRSAANATYSAYGELKRQETFAANGQILHAYFFDVLGGDGKPKGSVVEKIAADFGSYDAWLQDLKACGMAARGWAVLAYDPSDRKLHNFLGDAHNQGGIWGARPVLPLDVYEHAYFADYGSDRKSYIEAFVAAIDWDKVEANYKQAIA